MTEKNTLVSGIAGLIGSKRVHRLVLENHDVTVKNRLWRGSLDGVMFPDGEFDLRVGGRETPEPRFV